MKLTQTLSVTQTMLSQIILGIRYVYHRMFPGSKVPSRCEGFDYGLALVMDVFVQWPFYASSCANPIDLTDFLRQSPWRVCRVYTRIETLNPVHRTVNISRRYFYVTVFVAALFAIITTVGAATSFNRPFHADDYAQGESFTALFHRTREYLGPFRNSADQTLLRLDIQDYVSIQLIRSTAAGLT